MALGQGRFGQFGEDHALILLLLLELGMLALFGRRTSSREV